MIRPGEIYMAETDAGIRPVVAVSREELNRGNRVVAVLITSAKVVAVLITSAKFARDLKSIGARAA
jgi:mRNA-degrading endonuclease toxin of MazEF toxin-antitoxin module